MPKDLYWNCTRYLTVVVGHGDIFALCRLNPDVPSGRQTPRPHLEVMHLGLLQEGLQRFFGAFIVALVNNDDRKIRIIV